MSRRWCIVANRWRDSFLRCCLFSNLSSEGTVWVLNTGMRKVTATETRVGDSFGKYELKALLGKGGMGEVYEAYDTDKGRNVALKILPDQYAQDERYRARFLRESHAAAILQEPHVVPIHDWGEIDGNLYIDMRLVQGQTLHDLINRGPLEPERAVAIIAQIAEALDAAHDEGLIHRDIKPQNIIVTSADFAYLVDFGIAETQGETRLTMAGTQIGSFAYMAPERFNDAQSSPASDIYSLACVLHEALTGDLPFASGSYEQLIAAHVSSPPPRPSEVNKRVPASLDHVIARGMAKDPDDRYGSAAALGRAAKRALRASADVAAADANTQMAPWISQLPRTLTPANGGHLTQTGPTTTVESPADAPIAGAANGHRPHCSLSSRGVGCRYRIARFQRSEPEPRPGTDRHSTADTDRHGRDAGSQADRHANGGARAEASTSGSFFDVTSSAGRYGSSAAAPIGGR